MKTESKQADSRRLLVRLGLSIVAIVAAHLVDGWAFEHLQAPRFAETDLGRMLRVLGFLPLWIVVGLAMALAEERAAGWRGRSRRGVLVVAAAAGGGIVAELLKIVVRRERPSPAGGYRFRPWELEPLHTGGLGLPSSHALVAFAALATLGWIYPRARPLFWALGAGCAYGRVAAGAHFVSDVVVSAVIGSFVALLLARWVPRVGGTPLE